MVTFVFYVVIQVLSSLNFIYVHFWSPSGSGISGWHCCSVRFNCFDANSPICLMQAFLTEQCVYTQTYRHDDITHHTIDHGGITLREKDASAVTKNERRRRSSRIRSCSKNGQTKGFIWSSLSHTKASCPGLWPSPLRNQHHEHSVTQVRNTCWPDLNTNTYSQYALVYRTTRNINLKSILLFSVNSLDCPSSPL